MSESERRRAGRAVVPSLLLMMVTVLFLARPASCQYPESPYTTVDFGTGYGAMALSLGGAFIADGKGLAAAAYNPAGLARLTGLEISLGAGLGGQSVSAPYGPSPSRFTLLPLGNPYDWRFSRTSLRHAGAAVVLQGGGRIVLGVSYHREIDSRASFAYSIERDGPSEIYDPAISSDVISGTAQQSENYTVRNSGGWDIMTGTLAFRILKNVYFGANVNFNKGLDRRSTVADYSIVFSASGVSLTGQGSIIEEFSRRYPTFVDMDFGLQWVAKFCSAGFVLRTGSRVDYTSDSVHHESLTYSSGTVLLDDARGSIGGEFRRPTRYGLGLSLHPWRRLTASVDYETSQNHDAIGFPRVWDQLRTGAEFLLPLPGLELPVRAGWFSVKTNIDEPGGWAWMRAFTFGTGLTWKALILDVGAVLHSKSFPYDASAELERSAWDIVATLTFRSGK